MIMLRFILTALPFVISAGMALMALAFILISTSSPWVVIVMTMVAFIAETASFNLPSFKLGLWIFPGDVFAIFAAAGIFGKMFGSGYESYTSDYAQKVVTYQLRQTLAFPSSR